MFPDLCALVVEDDAQSLIAISSLLKELGIQFKRNTNGADVLNQLKTMKPSANFVLLNMDLPDGDAYDICRQIRLDPETQLTPVIAVGDNFSCDNFKRRLQECGFDAYAYKPLARKRFSDFLGGILEGKPMFEHPLSHND